MSLELRDLELFIGIAEVGGFRRAATQLSVRQSILSRRVRNPEETFGVSLFERHRAGQRLTHVGDLQLGEPL